MTEIPLHLFPGHLYCHQYFPSSTFVTNIDELDEIITVKLFVLNAEVKLRIIQN